MKTESRYFSETVSSEMDGGDPGCVVRVRGLPWSASQEEVASFLEDVNIVGGKDGVQFTFVRDGRPSGEAYIQVASEEDVQKACAHDKRHMGKRYIEVFRSKASEMDWVVKRNGPDQHQVPNNDAVIRLRGLPFGCSKEEVAHFFSGMEIVANGITLLQDAQGRTTGDAYVQFASQDIAEMAQSKHKERIGHRYIEIFKSSLADVKHALAPRVRGLMNSPMSRPSPYDRGDRFGGNMSGSGGNVVTGGMGQGMSYGRGRGRSNMKGYYDDGFDDSSSYNQMGSNYGGAKTGGMAASRRGGSGGGGRSGGRSSGGGWGGSSRGGDGGGSSYMDDHQSQTGHTVHMRGLPFAANEQDIIEFFTPLTPVNVVIHMNNEGRASGEADVDFSSHEEAREGMKRDRCHMQHRYVELFIKSTADDCSQNYGANNFNTGMAQGMGFGNVAAALGQTMANNGYSNQGTNNYSTAAAGGYNTQAGNAGNMGAATFGNPNYTAF